MNTRNYGHALNTCAPNLTSDALRGDLAAIGTRFRRELKPLFGAGPDALLDAVISWLERAEDMSRDALLAGVDWRWETFADYLGVLDRLPKGTPR